MNMTQTNHNIIVRRAELMAELFLQELAPSSIARPPQDFGFDLLVAFENTQGGTNMWGVEIKGAENVSEKEYLISRRTYDLLAHSSIPGLLLVADVKRNTLFYAFPGRIDTRKVGPSVRIPIHVIDRSTKKSLRERLRVSNI